MRDSKASSRDITQRRPNEVSISREPLVAGAVAGGVSTARDEGGRTRDLFVRPLMCPRLTLPLQIIGEEEGTAPGVT